MIILMRSKSSISRPRIVTLSNDMVSISLEATAHLGLLDECLMFTVDVGYLLFDCFLRIDGDIGLFDFPLKLDQSFVHGINVINKGIDGAAASAVFLVLDIDFYEFAHGAHIKQYSRRSEKKAG